MWLGAYGPDIGNLSIMVWCLREREMMMDLLQELGGSRMHYNFPRIGGVKRSSTRILAACSSEIEALPKSNSGV